MEPITTTELIIAFLHGYVSVHEEYVSVQNEKETISAYHTNDLDKVLEIQQVNKHGEIEVTRMKLKDYSTDQRLWILKK